jgi:hypothetical protein
MEKWFKLRLLSSSAPVRHSASTVIHSEVLKTMFKRHFLRLDTCQSGVRQEVYPLWAEAYP